MKNWNGGPEYQYINVETKLYMHVCSLLSSQESSDDLFISAAFSREQIIFTQSYGFTYH